MERLPYRAKLPDYQQQAATLLNAWRTGDESAVRFFWQHLPRFRRTDVSWLPKQLSEADVRKEPIDEQDARAALARWYDFRDWPALEQWVDAVGAENSAVSRFESAVEAVVDGDAATLQHILAAHPDLVAARS